MSTAHILLLTATALIVVFRAVYFKRTLWNYPQEHGPRFYMGIEVPDGFYRGEGLRWVRQWRRLVIAEHAVEAAVLVSILTARRWDWLPVWAGGSAPFFVVTLLGFVFYARTVLARTAPAQRGVAVSLESRPLTDYLSVPAEAALLLVVAASWFLLLAHGKAIDWQNAVVMSWAALGLLPGKIILVRSHFPLPPDNPGEHEQRLDAWRRYSLRIMNAMCWFLVVILAGYAVQHSPLAAGWLRWLTVALSLIIWFRMMVLLVNGRNNPALARGLGPAGSWTGPYGRPHLLARGGLVWSGAYVGGLFLLFVILR